MKSVKAITFKHKALVFSFCLAAVAALLSGCGSTSNTAPADGSYPETVTPSPLYPVVEKGDFTFKRIFWNSNAIYIYGTSDLPQETSLLLQFNQDGQQVDWIDGPVESRVRDNHWNVQIKAKSKTIPDRVPALSAGYTFLIWPEDNPSAEVEFSIPYPENPYKPSKVLEKTAWELVSLLGEPPLANSQITLEFDIANPDSLNGRSGVNYYGGSYLAEQPESLYINEMIITLMAGTEDLMQQEQVYLETLLRSGIFKTDGQVLRLYDDITGELALIFNRQP
jgi:heat shock protein HslJ